MCNGRRFCDENRNAGIVNNLMIFEYGYICAKPFKQMKYKLKTRNEPISPPRCPLKGEVIKPVGAELSKDVTCVQKPNSLQLTKLNNENASNFQTKNKNRRPETISIGQFIHGQTRKISSEGAESANETPSPPVC